MDSKNIMEINDSNVMSTYGRFPIAIERGEGSRVYDCEGREYIDFASGIGTSSVGHGNEKLVCAVAQQAAKLCHCSNLYYSEPSAKLAEILCRRSGMDKVFFANSGGEANEGAMKLARKYSSDKYGMGRGSIVTLMNSFHGRTMATLTATGQNVFHNYFYPFPDGYRYAVANDFDSIENACGSDVCAIMIELIQGEGGVIPLEEKFVRSVANFCKARDILLIIDEVQTGIGRTGSFFAYQNPEFGGLTPDIVTFAKGIAGGLPLGGFMASESLAHVLVPGTHGTTFGANPVSAAAALAVMEILDDGTIAQVAKKGDYIRRQIDAMDIPYLNKSRGLGLMIGVPVSGRSSKFLASKLNTGGLLTLTAGTDALRFLPPLTITTEEIDAGLAIFKSVAEEFQEEER